MTNQDLTKIAFDISNSLAALNQNMESVLSKMADHETRLHNLEQYHPINKDESFKNDMLKLLCKALIIAGVTIAVLSGAGGIISKIFGL